MSDGEEKKPEEPLSEAIEGRIARVEEALKSQLIEQEHRWVSVMMNVYECWHLPHEHPHRKAAIRALFWRIFSGRTVAAAAATGGLVVFSVLGLITAIQANLLLQRQNEKIDQQSFLIEAQRRATLVTEFTSVLEQIESERTSARAQNLDGPLKLSAATIGRIAALTRSYRPYRYLAIDGDSDGRLVSMDVATPVTKTDTDSRSEATWWDSLRRAPAVLFGMSDPSDAPTLIRLPMSPERGQLLLTLVNASIDMGSLLAQFPDFSRSDLRNAVLAGADLSHIRANSSNFLQTDMLGTKFKSALLGNADFEQACLSNVDFEGAMLEGASLRDAKLSGAFVPDPRQLSNTDLQGAELSGLRVLGQDWLVRLVQQERPPKNFDPELWTLQRAGDASDPQVFVVKPKTVGSKKNERLSC